MARERDAVISLRVTHSAQTGTCSPPWPMHECGSPRRFGLLGGTVPHSGPDTSNSRSQVRKRVGCALGSLDTRTELGMNTAIVVADYSPLRPYYYGGM